MTPRLSTRFRMFFRATVLLVVALFWVFRYECYSAEAAGATCLAHADWVLALISKIGGGASQHSTMYFLIATGLGAGAVIALALPHNSESRRPRWKTLYIIAILIALSGELAALLRVPALTLALHILSLATALASFRVLSRQSPELLTQGWIEPTSPRVPPRWLEIVAVALIFLVIGVTRFHALNRTPSNFDGEGCTHRPISTSWTYIFEQEAGEHVQQSSGMSWPIMHRWFTRPEHPTLFYLDERMLGVAISFAACLIVFFGFRYLQGPFTGLLALITYGFGPLDLEWSRLPVLHHFPVAVGALLAIASFAAFGTRTWKSFFALSLLIALTKFIYPSGKLLSAGPILGFIGVLLWHRQAWKGHKRKLSFIVVGLALFFTLRPFIAWLAYNKFSWIGPFAVLQPDPLADTTWGLFKVHTWQAFGFFHEIFYGPFDLTHRHWTEHATIEPARSVISVCSVFAMLALTRLLFLIRHPYAIVSIGLIVGGLVPGIAAGVSERRIAFTLVFVSFLAIMELSWFLNTIVGASSKARARVVKSALLVCIGAPLFVFQTHSFFSRPAGKHMQLIMTEAIRPLLRDGTLVIQPSSDYRCEIFYGIYDILKAHEGRIGYTNPYEAEQTEAESIVQPRINPGAWFYRFTDIKAQLPVLTSTQSWPRYLFVMQYTEHQRPLRELLEKTYPQGRLDIIQTEEATKLRFLVFDTAPEANK